MRPEVALRYLDDAHGDLTSIIPPLLRGLESSAADAARERIESWIERKEHLAQVLWYYRFTPDGYPSPR